MLKKRNGEQKYAYVRNSLFKIAENINNIEKTIHGGGTMYSHFSRRILGDIEYEIYLDSQNDSFIKRNKNFDSQKKIFLHHKKMMILDCDSAKVDSLEKDIFAQKKLTIKAIKKEIQGDTKMVDAFVESCLEGGYANYETLSYSIETDNRMKLLYKKELLKRVLDLDKLINNSYYLFWAMRFYK